MVSSDMEYCLQHNNYKDGNEVGLFCFLYLWYPINVIHHIVFHLLWHINVKKQFSGVIKHYLINLF